MASLRVLELYSGIGGMHCGLTESGVSANIVAAVDVNTTANEVYRYNFPKTPLWPKSIEGITLKELDALAFDMILMSPPCQPFTRIGLQADVSDPRAKSFLYILDILPRLKKTPSYILLENVKGFESSIAREALVQTLEKCGYRYQEFLLSPTCILEEFPLEPNFSSSAHCLEGNVQAVTDEKNMISYPIYVTKQCSEGELLYKLETAGEMQRKLIQDNDSSVRMLEDFLETNVKDLDQYFLPSKSLLRYALILDIVKPTCRRSTCFTKGYGHYVEGTGSVIQTATDVEIESVYKSLDNLSQEEKLAKLATLKMRYFTPREIANLHGFPSSFGFPEKITTKQRYRLLGNSLNVHIVANLISILLH
ncbi:tRNA (cytosine(38)-C(5))-methyltransferase isoform X2 [Bombina bombina]|uniref:tRNA (cytosine(38)-C(5))-methyltransferase isoform X2 n=1 Tax=Bombina bombina TaxID=8345 RepID=UPI00235A8AE0|nr:tRNA (cytosine(38)-C(5))-methyltransferase isoform X2 [Bombina bombina]